MQQSRTSFGPPRITNKIEEARNRFNTVRARFHRHIVQKNPDLTSINPDSISSPIYQGFPPHSQPLQTQLVSPRPINQSLSGDLSLKVAMDCNGEQPPVGSRQSRAPIAAIFVHAGAGYHSTTNEHIHLGACADAAKVAMRFLRSGGSALEAIEAAIRVLEDKEITNAGYGSNLTIDGIVECDATIIDHLGRSGACGAVAKIKNPIHLARIILEQSSRPLSLRRVPPNLLIADGAADFGWEHGIDIVAHDALVSKNARDRFVRWREDIKKADAPQTLGSPNTSNSAGEEMIDLDYEDRVRAKQRRDHFNALMNGTWNEGQPDSPQAGSTTASPDAIDNMQNLAYFPSGFLTSKCSTSPGKGPRMASKSRSDTFVRSRSPSSPDSRSQESVHKRARLGGSRSSDGHNARTHSLLRQNENTGIKDAPKTGSHTSSTTISSKVRQREGDSHDGSADDGADDFYIATAPSLLNQENKQSPPMFSHINEDRITDTVGAIAIDIYGNIAAGSSSGGIGMKHRGRIGPAALVGVGTAVIPADIEDSENVSVAAVTSGTGEHMATTMASQKCAERLYFCNKRGRGGLSIEATEEEAIESFIINDFMGHPGVRNSHSTGAIGVMAVKKTPYGYFLHFAHNTDSFALASMHSREKEPKCVMSRLGDYGSVVQGGRKVRVE